MKKRIKKRRANPFIRMKRQLGEALLRRHKLFQVLFVITGAIASGIIATWALFLDVTIERGLEIDGKARLDVDVADEADLLMESKQAAYETPPPIPPSAFGL